MPQTFIVEHPSNRLEDRKYAHYVLLAEFLGLKYETKIVDNIDCVRLYLKEDGAKRMILWPDILFSMADEYWLKECSIQLSRSKLINPKRFLRRWEYESIEAMFINGNDTNLVVSESEVRLPFDILGAIFFQLTRYEEIANSRRDDKNRFLAKYSVNFAYGIIMKPIIDQYVEMLRQLIEIIWPSVNLKRDEYKLMLTHDADYPCLFNRGSAYWVLRQSLVYIIRHKSLQNTANALRSYILDDYKRDPAYTFEWIMDESEKRGIVSEFYFIPETNMGPDDLQVKYTLYDMPQQNAIKRIISRGHQVGIHPSYTTYNNRTQTLKELRLLEDALNNVVQGRKIRGGRQHKLRWENPGTWQIWDDLNLEYDSTLGYTDSPGFRAGTCKSYTTYNLVQKRMMALKEIPLIAMDCTFLPPFRDYKKIEEAGRLCCGLIDKCRSVNGRFVLLWHNNYLQYDWQRDFYREVISYAS